MRAAVIAVRSGSKGLPDKNIKAFLGKPLLAYSVEQARTSGIFDAIAVSSDSPAYLDVGARFGATHLIKRPDALAGDDVAKLPVLHHALAEIEKVAGRTLSVLVDLQATSPLRRAEDIGGAVGKLEENATLLNVISVSPTHDSPYFTLVEAAPDGTIAISKKPDCPVTRRQDLPPCYRLNGSIYAWRREAVLTAGQALTARSGFWLMPAELGYDIDTPLDFSVAEFVARHHLEWPLDENARQGCAP